MARLVYSTDGGRADDPERRTERILPPAEQAIRVRPERGGRKGKTVTVCAPFYLERKAATALAKRLKQRCGTGGTLKALDEGGFAIEIQGEHVERLVEALNASGYPTKRGGG